MLGKGVATRTRARQEVTTVMLGKEAATRTRARQEVTTVILGKEAATRTRARHEETIVMGKVATLSGIKRFRAICGGFMLSGNF